MSIDVTHDAGFFSCCSVRLHYIVEYINKHGKYPYDVNSSRSFRMYKKIPRDITFDFFNHYGDTNEEICSHVNYHWIKEHENYKLLDFKNILPIVTKFFTPTKEMWNISFKLQNKYKICASDCIGLYFRGTDKKIETPIGDFQTYLQKLNDLRATVPDTTKIIIQTDTAQFADFIKEQNIPNIIFIEENSVSYRDSGIHNEKTPAENYTDIKNLFATFLLLSKCKIFICSSGNCSIWSVFFRGSANNVYQLLNNKWQSEITQ